MIPTLELPKGDKSRVVTAVLPEEIPEYDQRRVDKYIQRLQKYGYGIVGIVWYWSEYDMINGSPEGHVKVLKCKIQTNMGPIFRWHGNQRKFYTDE